MLKLIEKSEMKKLILMIKSDDGELRNLAATILDKENQWVRWSMMSIVVFHMLLLICSVSGVIWLSYHLVVGWFFVPIVLALLFQTIISLAWLVTVADERESYDKVARKISEALT